MKLYWTSVVLQDIEENIKRAYSISMEPVTRRRDAFANIKRLIEDDSLVCCSAYIVEEDCKTDEKKIIYASNFVSIFGGYYPNVKAHDGVHFNIFTEMNRYKAKGENPDAEAEDA